MSQLTEMRALRKELDRRGVPTVWKNIDSPRDCPILSIPRPGDPITVVGGHNFDILCDEWPEGESRHGTDPVKVAKLIQRAYGMEIRK